MVHWFYGVIIGAFVGVWLLRLLINYLVDMFYPSEEHDDEEITPQILKTTNSE